MGTFCSTCTDDTNPFFGGVNTVSHRPRPPRIESTTDTYSKRSLNSPELSPLPASTSSLWDGPMMPTPHSQISASSVVSESDPNSFEALIVDSNKFFTDFANFIAKMNAGAKRRLWDHQVRLKELDGTYSTQSEISTHSKQLIHFMVDWCVVYTTFLDRSRPKINVKSIRPHMQQIGEYIFKNWRPITSGRFIGEKCYFSNMVKMYVNRYMKQSVSEIKKGLSECEICIRYNIPDDVISIISEYMVDDFECNLHESMVMKISSERNNETIYSLANIFDDGYRRHYRTGNREWVILLIKLSTKYHQIDLNDPKSCIFDMNHHKNYRKRDRKGFIITNVEIATPLNDRRGVDKCTIWIFENETNALSKYEQLNEYHTNANSESDDDLETYLDVEVEESVSMHTSNTINGEVSSKNRKYKHNRDENKYVAKFHGIRNMDGGKISHDMAYKGKYVLFKLRSENSENSYVNIAHLSIRIARL